MIIVGRARRLRCGVNEDHMEDWVTISEAAKRLGVSRRTVTRRIKSAGLHVMTDERDKRIRLVSFRAIEGLIVPLSGVWQQTIDDVLRVLLSHTHRIATALYPEGQPLSIEQARQSRVGRDLATLARLASGELKLPRSGVDEILQAVLQIMFWPPMADDYLVPRALWETGLGRMLSMARFSSFESNELMSIGQAAARLEITRPTLYRFMDDGVLNFVRDERVGRVYVVRRDVDALAECFQPKINDVDLT